MGVFRFAFGAIREEIDILSFSCHNLNSWTLWESLYAIVKGAQDGVSIPEDIISKAIACCSSVIMWFLEALDENSPAKVKLKKKSVLIL